MVYAVSLSGRAEADIYEAFGFAYAAAPEVAERWLNRLFDAIFSLEQFPQSCARIPEASHIGRELRQLVFGRRSGAFRIIFEIRDVQRYPCGGELIPVLRLLARTTVVTA